MAAHSVIIPFKLVWEDLLASSSIYDYLEAGISGGVLQIGAWRRMAAHGGAWRRMAAHGGAWRFPPPFSSLSFLEDPIHYRAETGVQYSIMILDGGYRRFGFRMVRGW